VSEHFSDVDLDRLAELLADRLDERRDRHTRDRGPVAVDVAAYMASNPGSSANRVARSVPFSRPDVLWAVRALEEAATRYPSPGYHLPAEDAE
jgi:hypothetical protein